MATNNQQRQKYMRSVSMQVVAKHFRRMNSVAMNLEDHAQSHIPLEDEFTHLKIRDVKQIVIGLVFVFAISVCTAMLNNVVKNTIVTGFHAPAFLLWVRSAYRILTFPAFLILNYIYQSGKFQVLKLMARQEVKREAKRKARIAAAGQREPATVPVNAPAMQSTRALIRDATQLYGDKKVSFERFSRDILVLAALTVLSQYCNFAPLFASRSTGCLAALGSCSILLVFFFSAFFLNVEINSTKVFGVLFFMAGIAMLLTIELQTNKEWLKTIGILAGALTTAIYQIVFKLRIGGTTNLGRISFSVSLLAVVTFVLLWPLVLALRLTGIEQWDILDLPWEMLMRTSCTAWALVFLVNLGVAWVNPFFTSFGFLMAVPFTYVFDSVWNDSTVPGTEVGGATLLCVGFVLLVFGDVLTWKHIQRDWKTVEGNATLAWRNARKSVYAKAHISEPYAKTGGLSHIVHYHAHGHSRTAEVPVSVSPKTGIFRKISLFLSIVA